MLPRPSQGGRDDTVASSIRCSGTGGSQSSRLMECADGDMGPPYRVIPLPCEWLALIATAL